MHCPDNVLTRYRRSLARGLAIAAVAAALAGCKTTDEYYAASIPNDYRLRHPIAIKEGPQTLDLFVGAGRGGLTPMQQAQVVGFAQNWRLEATGGVIIDRPVGSPNERAAAATVHDVLSILTAVGIPNTAIRVLPYRPRPGVLATVRLNHPRMIAQVAPCGLWPDDVGPTYDRLHYENKPYWNLGCATQRNLAAMVDNPADLVQPRAETPAYTAKRVFGKDKWRKGESPATIYPDSNKGAISDLGK